MSVNTSTSLKAVPRYFITRPDGTRTPVIALDELPHTVQVRNVPKNLTSSDTEGMVSLGQYPRADLEYTVDITNHETIVSQQS